MGGTDDVYEGTVLNLVVFGMAAAGGLDGVILVVKIAGALVQVDGYAGIGTRVRQGIRSGSAIQFVGACQPFDDVGATVSPVRMSS